MNSTNYPFIAISIVALVLAIFALKGIRKKRQESGVRINPLLVILFVIITGASSTIPSVSFVWILTLIYLSGMISNANFKKSSHYDIAVTLWYSLFIDVIISLLFVSGCFGSLVTNGFFG